MNYAVATAFLSILSLSACSSGSNTNSEQDPNVGQAIAGDNPIFGLWTFPQVEDPDVPESSEIDYYAEFFELTEDSWIFYVTADVLNCYEIDKLPMTNLGGSTYSVDFGDEFIGVVELDLQASENTLFVGSIDTFDDDNDGDTTELQIETTTRVEHITPVDFNICS